MDNNLHSRKNFGRSLGHFKSLFRPFFVTNGQYVEVFLASRKLKWLLVFYQRNMMVKKPSKTSDAAKDSNPLDVVGSLELL